MIEEPVFNCNKETQEPEETDVFDQILQAYTSFIAAMRIARLQAAGLPGSYNNDRLMADISNTVVRAEIEQTDFLEFKFNPFK